MDPNVEGLLRLLARAAARRRIEAERGHQHLMQQKGPERRDAPRASTTAQNYRGQCAADSQSPPANPRV